MAYTATRVTVSHIALPSITYDTDLTKYLSNFYNYMGQIYISDLDL